MKLLIDNCISHLLASALRAQGHDVERLPSAGIIILDPNIVPANHEEACMRAITTHAAELLAGAVVIVMSDRMRARASNPDA